MLWILFLVYRVGNARDHTTVMLLAMAKAKSPGFEKVTSFHFPLLIDELLVAAELFVNQGLANGPRLEDTESTERTTPRGTGITSWADACFCERFEWHGWRERSAADGRSYSGVRCT